MKEEVFELYEEFLNGMLDNFRMAVKSQYCRNVQKDEFETLKIIYKLLTGSDIGGKYGCSRCIYNVVKAVGELYLKYLYEKQQKLLMEGKPRKQIKEEIKKKYNISDITADRDLAEANKKLAEQIDLTANAYKVLLNSRLEELYNRAMQKNDLKSAIASINSQMKLNGLDVQKQDISVLDNTFTIKID